MSRETTRTQLKAVFAKTNTRGHNTSRSATKIARPNQNSRGSQIAYGPLGVLSIEPSAPGLSILT